MIHDPVQPAASTAVDPQRVETISRFFAAIQAGDYPVLMEVLTPDAITRWPQSGELITGAMACVRVYENYPGGTTELPGPAHFGRRRRVGRGAGQ